MVARLVYWSGLYWVIYEEDVSARIETGLAELEQSGVPLLIAVLIFARFVLCRLNLKMWWDMRKRNEFQKATEETLRKIDSEKKELEKPPTHNV